jgi:alcohol dehydrogenase class IV
VRRAWRRSFKLRCGGKFDVFCCFIARFVGLTHREEEAEAGRLLGVKIRRLEQTVGQPTSIAEMGITAQAFQTALKTIIPQAETDNSMLAAPRIPETEELQQLFEYAYTGKTVDF